MVPAVYALHTRRLVLRCYEPRDASAMQAVLASSRRHLMRFLPWAADEPQSTADKLERILHFRAEFHRGVDRVFGIFAGPGAVAESQDPAQGDLLGGVGLHARGQGPDGREVGYWIAEAHEGRGYVGEAVRALVRLGFGNLGLNKLEIRCAVENLTSQRVAERIGFQLDGTLRAQIPAADGGEAPWDARVYSLLAREYRVRQDEFPKVRSFDALGQPMESP